VSLCGRAATPRCGRVIGPLGDPVALRLCGGVTCTQDHTITAWLGVRGHKVGLLRGVPAEVAHSGLGVAGCEFTVTATPASASVARDRVSRWLRGAGWPPEPLERVATRYV
jgi:hypothetical protein